MPEQGFDNTSLSDCDDFNFFGRDAQAFASSKIEADIDVSSVELDADVPKEFMSYDEFRLMLERDEDDALVVEDIAAQDEVPDSKKFSFVSRWRRKIDPVEIGPPSSPLTTCEFPSSPVAVIHPTQLCVTSLPPYDLKTASRLAGASSPESSTDTIVDRPMHFHDLYDVELECMIDEAAEVESSFRSESSISAAVYVPPTQVRLKRTPKKAISSVVRWLPMRIKYTLLSSTTTINKRFRK